MKKLLVSLLLAVVIGLAGGCSTMGVDKGTAPPQLASTLDAEEIQGQEVLFTTARR